MRQAKSRGFSPYAGIGMAEPGGVGGGANVGFTSPDAITTEIHAVDHAAESLFLDFAREVPIADETRKAFESWRLGVWQPFRDKNLGIGRFGGGLAFLGTDELMAQTQARRSELEGFAARYQKITSKQPSSPIPTDPRPNPPQPGQPGSPSSGAPSWWPSWAPQVPKLEVPWWVWVGGTVLVAGGGYLAYRSWKTTREEIQRQQSEVFKILPTVLGHGGGGEVMAAGHDPASCPSCGGG